MFQQLIQQVRSRTAQIAKQITLKQNQPVVQQIETISKEEQEYRQALKKNRSFIRKVLLGESPQLTLLTRCIHNRVCKEKVLEYGEQAIWELYCNKDYLNTRRCGEITLPYVQKEIEKDHMSIGHISLIMAEVCLKQGDYLRAIQYLSNAEESFHLNQEELSEEETYMNYYYSLTIGQIYSKMNMVNKSFFYAMMCLKTRRLSFQQKIPPCQLILNYYITKQNMQDAKEFGQSILNQVSFKNILNKCRPQEIESICDIYKVMIDLEDDQQKLYVLIDQFLLLLSITKSTDQQLINSLKEKQSSINQSFNKDLLYVLGFYGQKLKLETCPEQKSQQNNN